MPAPHANQRTTHNYSSLKLQYQTDRYWFYRAYELCVCCGDATLVNPKTGFHFIECEPHRRKSEKRREKRRLDKLK